MRVTSLIPQREAKTVTSESYKSLIKQYMELRNYIELSNSSIEGHLPDIVFIQPYLNDRQIWVEAKWDTFSLFDKANRGEFIKYMVEYFSILNVQQRFNLYIFTKHLNSKAMHEDLSSNVKRMGKLLENIKKEADSEQQRVLDLIELEDFSIFLQDVSIYIGDAEHLQIQIVSLKDSISSDSPIKGLEKQISDKIEHPPSIVGEEQIICNLFKLNIPRFWGAVSRFRDTKEVFETIKNPPPFIMYGGKIYTIFAFDKFNAFWDYIYPNTIVSVSPIDWLTNEELNRPLVWLVNAIFEKICYLKGLRYDKEIRFHYCKKSSQISSRWMKEAGFTREFVKHYESAGYYRNSGVSARGLILGGELYVQITPRKTFTEDGDKLLPSELRKRRDEKFRKSQYNYNNNMLNDTKYWIKFLFDINFVKDQRLGSSQDFQTRSIKMLRQIYRSFTATDLELVDVNWQVNDALEPIQKDVEKYFNVKKSQKKPKIEGISLYSFMNIQQEEEDDE